MSKLRFFCYCYILQGRIEKCFLEDPFPEETPAEIVDLLPRFFILCFRVCKSEQKDAVKTDWPPFIGSVNPLAVVSRRFLHAIVSLVAESNLCIFSL